MRMMPVRPTELAVAGEETSGKTLRQGKVRRVVGRGGISQFPDAIQKGNVLMPYEGQVDEILQSLLRTFFIHVACEGESTKNLRDLYVDQMRRVQ